MTIEEIRAAYLKYRTRCGELGITPMGFGKFSEEQV